VCEEEETRLFYGFFVFFLYSDCRDLRWIAL